MGKDLCDGIIISHSRNLTVGARNPLKNNKINNFLSHILYNSVIPVYRLTLLADRQDPGDQPQEDIRDLCSPIIDF